VPVWDDQGNMTFVKTPHDYDWDGLMSSAVANTGLLLPELPMLPANGEETVNRRPRVARKKRAPKTPRGTLKDSTPPSESGGQ
jgi:hypothetical protein